MENNELVEMIKDYFLFFQKCLYPSYHKPSFNKKELVMIDNFIKRLNHQQKGPKWIIDYFLYTYNYWHELKTHRAITLGWIIGSKAFDRFNEERNVLARKRIYSNLKIVGNLHIEFNKLIYKYTAKRKWFSDVKSYEEKEKSKFFNTEKGYGWCLVMTSLFHPQSAHCAKCKFKESCKQTLQQEYPIIAQNRSI